MSLMSKPMFKVKIDSIDASLIVLFRMQGETK